MYKTMNVKTLIIVLFSFLSLADIAAHVEDDSVCIHIAPGTAMALIQS